MHRVTNIPILCINEHLTCKLCNGYLIDATTIVECLHSFCRTCIVKHLELSTTCPVCDTVLHKTRPHYAIRPDHALQAIVYKLIPGLFEKEMSCRRDFYKHRALSETRSLSPEKRGDITLNAYVIQEEEPMSIELEYWQPEFLPELVTVTSCGSALATLSTDSEQQQQQRSTYLLCPPNLTVGHLEKLIRVKFELKPGEYDVALFSASSCASTSTTTTCTTSSSSDDLFKSSYTLSDLACLYTWRRNQPMKLYFTIVQTPTTKAFGTTISTVPINSKANGFPRPSGDMAVCTTTTAKSSVSPTVPSPGHNPVKGTNPSGAGGGDTVTQTTNCRTRLSSDSGSGANCPGSWETVPAPTSSCLPSTFANSGNSLASIGKLTSSITTLLGSPTSVCSPRA